ncbi:MAG: hypothetical protein PHX82_00615 [Paracoccaceae bacterium]|nr:hypothetical protein [Paracoccaceae bacterium]
MPMDEGAQVDDFSSLMRDWIMLPTARKDEMRDAARACHRENFSLDGAANALRTVLEEISQ